MTYLLDTNVLSEVRKGRGRANAEVLAWMEARHLGELHLSAITILEIERGILSLARRNPAQADGLRTWLEQSVLGHFGGRIHEVDVRVARATAALHVPDPRPDRDALIAATAIVHNLTVVTRNVADFAPVGVRVLDPWTAHPWTAHSGAARSGSAPVPDTV